MENNIVYEKEGDNDSLNDESKSSFKQNQIDGSGSQSLISFNSQHREVTHSTLSSIKRSGQLNNSIDNSNNNLINSNNELSSISEESLKDQINNMDKTTVLGPKLSMYNNFFSEDSKDNNCNTDNEQFMKIVEEKIKEGYIPFYLKAKGYKPYFYFGSQNSKFKKSVEHYIKTMNCPEEIKNTFYYNNKLIDINATIKDLNIKPLSVISNEIE